MLPRDILISLVIFGMFMSGAFLILGSMYSSYGIPYNDTSATYNRISTITAQTDTMKSSIENSGTSVIGDILLFPKGVWESIKLTLNSGLIIKDVSEDVGNDYNVPPIYINAFLAIATIMIIFGIVSAIVRKKV